MGEFEMEMVLLSSIQRSELYSGNLNIDSYKIIKEEECDKQNKDFYEPLVDFLVLIYKHENEGIEYDTDEKSCHLR
jgi:hypothetical protein